MNRCLGLDCDGRVCVFSFGAVLRHVNVSVSTLLGVWAIGVYWIRDGVILYLSNKTARLT